MENINEIISSKPNFANYKLAGNYNIPGYSWERLDDVMYNTGHHISLPVRQSTVYVCESINPLNLQQFIKSENRVGNILDLFITYFNNSNISLFVDPLSKLDIYHNKAALIKTKLAATN